MAEDDAEPQGTIGGLRLIATFLAAAVLATLVAPTVVGLAERRRVLSIEFQPIEAPEFEPLPERSEVVGPDGRHVAYLHGRENRQVVRLRELPDHLWQAVLAAEDRRFFEHPGYDSRAIARAAVENLRAQEIVQGGSTITQQLAKTFVGDDLTLGRKAEELRYALALEGRYSKRQLLERYINEVYFGAGAYGIEAAAEEFFGRSADSLAVEQAALLAALVRAPTDLDPRRHPDAARRRRDAVLAVMAEDGYLSPRDAVVARLAPLEVVDAPDRRHRHPDIVAAVQREFLDNPAFGDGEEERSRLLLTGGLQVATTIDVDLQRRTADLLADRFPEPAGVTAAVAAVDPRTGAVRVVVSGRDPHRTSFNSALQARRQPGSAYKPFVLAAALERGLSLRTTLQGRSGARFGSASTTGEWATRGVRNFAGRSYGNLTAAEALVESVNTAFADLVVRVGPEAVVAVTDRLGIPQEAYGDTVGHAIALGGLHRGVSPLEMAAAYATFANDGVHVPAHVIERVVDREGTELHLADREGRRALPPEINAAVADALVAVVRRGTGVRAQLPGHRVAGKTGTTQEHRDIWFVGTVPSLAAAVWVGNPDDRQELAGMSSGSTAAPLWRDVMVRALE